jgi:hypothetical protein
VPGTPAPDKFTLKPKMKALKMTRSLPRVALMALATWVLLSASPPAVRAADAQRQAEVAGRGADVMPFDLKSTVHVFTKTAVGGTQRVVARKAADTPQVGLVREHLHAIRAQFLRGDFSGPSHIHGKDMPGLAELEAAAPGQLAIDYRDVVGGAELDYRSTDARLVAALHAWFDAQLADHGADAIAGHPQHQHGDMKPQ